MHVMRELLDKQIVDREEEPVGRVDGIVAELRAGQPPRIVQFEVGFVPMARRIHRGLEGWSEKWHKRFGIRRSARYHIAWDDVIEENVHHIKVDVTAEETVAYDWERWLRRHVIGRIPGATREE